MPKRYVCNNYIYTQFLHSDTDRQETCRGVNHNENKVSTGRYADSDGSVKYGPNVVYKKVNKVLYLEFLKDVCGILLSTLLSYINMRKYLETDSFRFNPYDPCVDNNII